jgi:hypothetical protein
VLFLLSFSSSLSLLLSRFFRIKLYSAYKQINTNSMANRIRNTVVDVETMLGRDEFACLLAFSTYSKKCLKFTGLVTDKKSEKLLRVLKTGLLTVGSLGT